MLTVDVHGTFEYCLASFAEFATARPRSDMTRGPVKKLKKFVRERFRYARQFRESRSRCSKYAGLLDEVKVFCLFIGYPRSGHSLVGALLDAHENVAMAHELNAIRHQRYGFGRHQILYLILENAAELASRGRVTSGFDYSVPGQWQGRFRNLEVIGDKKGGGTTRILLCDSGAVRKFRETMGVDVKCLHILRNPFDNIATIARRRRHGKIVRPGDLELATEFYLRRLRVNVAFAASGECPTLDVRLEDLIEDSRATLIRACEFLGLTASPDYLDACAGIVYPLPHRSRSRFEWPPALLERICAEIARHPVLEGYAFES